MLSIDDMGNTEMCKQLSAQLGKLFPAYASCPPPMPPSMAGGAQGVGRGDFGGRGGRGGRGGLGYRKGHRGGG